MTKIQKELGATQAQHLRSVHRVLLWADVQLFIDDCETTTTTKQSPEREMVEREGGDSVGC
jgi:hypothetical protein